MNCIYKLSTFLLLTLVFSLPLNAQDIHKTVQENDLDQAGKLLSENPDLINAKDEME